MAGAKQAIRTPELGSLVSLDHVNLRVPDQRLATLFFIEGLGFTRDPYRMTGTYNMWINLGQQQFHLPTTEPTPFPGVIGLVVPDLARIRERLERVAPMLAGTEFAWRESRGTLLVHDPWGRQLRLHAAGSLPALMPLALAYVELWVPPRSVGAIGAFYQQMLNAPQAGGSPAKARWVAVGPHQTLRFVERAGFKPYSHNNHIALYLTGYRAVYANLRKRRALMEKDRYEQFRFNRILNLKTGKEIISLEHEMRSLYHGDYTRALVNRGDLGGRIGRVVGRDI